MASAFYTQWSVLKAITLKNTAAPTTVTTITDNKNFRNTWNFALGANYRLNTRWLLMAGLGYDQSPTRDGYRDIRMPDSNHTTLSIGAELTARPNVSFDFGYAHIFMPQAKIDNHASKASDLDLMSGTANTDANLISVQLNWVFN